MATKKPTKSKPIINRKKLKTAYCHTCETFVETELVDIKVTTTEMSPAEIMRRNSTTGEQTVNYDISESNHTVTKCKSCGHYDNVKNNTTFSDAVYELVTNEVLKALKRHKAI